jgi:hypothetical protein
MVSDSAGYVVGEKGAVVKLGPNPSPVVIFPYYDLNVKIFPSPATDRIIVGITDLAKPATLIVLDGSGREMLIRQITSREVQIDSSSWPSGIYFVSVRQEKKITVKKVVKE